MSFVDEVEGKDTFLGAIITESNSPVEAVKKTWKLKINPGGEVLIVEIPEDRKLDSRFLDRLLTREECAEASGGPVVRIGDLSKEDQENLGI
ncbi:MAG TPA: hypothetical protein VGF75_03680 [Candidatus Saccharimonadales bacterium]